MTTGMVEILPVRQPWKTHQGLNPLLAGKSCSLCLGMEKFTPLQSTSTRDPTKSLWNSGEVGIEVMHTFSQPTAQG